MTKTKSDFLTGDGVRPMAEWLRSRFRAGFVHRHTDRRTNKIWTCDGLFDAFGKYEWKKEGWGANKLTLGGRLKSRH